VLATDIAEEKFAPLADALIATRRLDVTEDHEIAALAGAQFQGASLIDTQLQGASLNNAQLQGASFDCAQLQGASLNGAFVRHLNLTPTRCASSF